MAEKSFGSFRDASAYARQLGKDGVKHKIKSQPLGFLVVYDDNCITEENQVFPNWKGELAQTIEDSKRYLETQEDCKQYIGEIFILLEHVQGNSELIADAIRAIRELEIRLPQLPCASSIEEKREVERKEQELCRKAPICPVCNIPMALRQSIHGYFWGCKNFSLPAREKCFRKKLLTNEERLILGSPF